MKQNRKWAGILLLAALVFAAFLPAQAKASTVIYVRQGATGYINFRNAPVPNTKWSTGNSSILKLGKCTRNKAVYTGKKTGTTTLTAYNKVNPVQKYVITVNVMPSGKLNRKDFELYGFEWLGFSAGTNLFDFSLWTTGTKLCYYSVKNQNPETARTVKIGDSLNHVRALYGKQSLVTFNKSKDKCYKYGLFKQPGCTKLKVKYYTDYKYGRKCRIRFYFDRRKRVVLFVYMNNYDKM